MKAHHLIKQRAASVVKAMALALPLLMLAGLAPPAAAGTLTVSVVDKEGKAVPDAVVVLVPSVAGTPKLALPTQINMGILHEG